MHFGRIDDHRNVDFSLPPLDAHALRILDAAHAREPAPAATVSEPHVEPHGAHPPWLRVGAPSFVQRPWVGTLYSPSSKQHQWLGLYAQEAGALELDATFYGVPEAATLSGWAAATPSLFRFCPKVPRDLSHQLPAAARDVEVFVERMRLLGDRLGPSLLQLPESFAPARLPALERLLAQLGRDFSVAVEVRHAGWFEHGALVRPLAEVLERHGALTVITDVAGRRDVCHGTLSAPGLLLRFVGEGDASDEPRLDAWLTRLCALRDAGLAQAYVFIHQPDDLLAPQTMASLTRKARARGVDIPEVRLVRPRGQLPLF